MPSAPDLADDDVQKLDRLRDAYGRLEKELGRVIIGQRETIERLAICLFARGHALLEGVPVARDVAITTPLAGEVLLERLADEGFLGGVALEVDGQAVDPAKVMTYKGMMGSGVPNLAIFIGYTNASWTLKCDLTSEYVCRLINHMDAHGYTRCCPVNDTPSVVESPLLDFSSGYVLRSIEKFPRQGSRPPWKLHQNYALDRRALRHAPIEDGVLRFSRA